jgi:hypothetical protein
LFLALTFLYFLILFPFKSYPKLHDNCHFSLFNYISKFEIKIVGNNTHKEIWIPAVELSEFNNHIIDKIKVSEAYYGDKYTGDKTIHLNF